MDVGNCYVSYMFDSVRHSHSFSWFLTGVYALHTRYEKKDCWEEIAAYVVDIGSHVVILLLDLWWREGVATELQTQCLISPS